MMHQPIAMPAPEAALLQGCPSMSLPRDPALAACEALAALDLAFPGHAPDDGEEKRDWHARWVAAFELVATTEATTIGGAVARMTVAADTEGTEAGIALLRSAIENMKFLTKAHHVSVPADLADDMGCQGETAREIERLAWLALNQRDNAVDILKQLGQRITIGEWDNAATLLHSVIRAAGEIRDVARRFDEAVDESQ